MSSLDYVRNLSKEVDEAKKISDQFENIRGKDTYILRQEISECSYGVIRKGTHSLSGNQVAIKLLDKKQIAEAVVDVFGKELKAGDLIAAEIKALEKLQTEDPKK